jgi:hypothetical protein
VVCEVAPHAVRKSRRKITNHQGTKTLKMEAICSSEMFVAFQGTTRRYISEDKTLQNHCCENLESYIKKLTKLGIMDLQLPLTEEE